MSDTSHHPDLAAAVARHLKPSRVLLVGSESAGLRAEFESLGIAVSAVAGAAPTEGTFDLTVLLGLPNALSLQETQALARELAASAPALLLEDAALLVAALGSLCFAPDLAFTGGPGAQAAVLFRRGPHPLSPEFISLYGEIFRLRAALAGAGMPSLDLENLRRELRDVSTALTAVVDHQGGVIDRLEMGVSASAAQVDDVLRSRIWRTLCAAGGVMLGASRVAHTVAARLARLRRRQPQAARGRDASQAGARPGWTSYDYWIVQFERRDEPLIRLKLKTFGLRPRISILMPVYRPDPALLKRAIDSVRAQSYPDWELCIADDCSGLPGITALLAQFAADDARICVTALDQRGGISAASNAALALASGGFIGLLDHDDELSRDALFHVADAFNSRPAAALIYSDEDKIDAGGRRHTPFFKPAWSPDLLLSENYICHFLVARRDLVVDAGGFRTGFDGSQDYDLILRLVERTAEIVRVPRVLYHWRTSPGSAAAELDAKPYAAAAALRAVAGYLERTSPGARVEAGCGPGRLRVRYPIPEGSRVSIIVPSGGNISVLDSCLESVFQKTTYRLFEVLVADNSRGGAVRRKVGGWVRQGLPVRYFDWRKRPFNYAAINNAAARACSSPLLLFLNDDTEVVTPDWLEAMVELGTRSGAGAVGAKLLYPDGRIQHAGVVLGVYEHCGHAFRGLNGWEHHYFDFPDVIRNVSAVTAACMLVPAEVFQKTGGFDADRFPISFNDIDLCLRIGRLGCKVLYTPHAVLYHHESLSRGTLPERQDRTAVAAMRTLWGDVIAVDPYYSPNLTRGAENYSLRTRAGGPGQQ